MLVECDWVSIRDETGIRLEYKKCASVEGSKLQYCYPGGFGLSFLYFHPSVNCLVAPIVHMEGEKSYRGRIVAVSATPEAAHILTFAHTVRPEIKMERSPPTTPPCCPQVSQSRPLGDTKHAKDTCGNFAIGQQSRRKCRLGGYREWWVKDRPRMA